MALTPEEAKKLNDIHGALFGINGNPGMISKFDDLSKGHYSLRNKFFILVAFLAGTGVLGLGACASRFFL